MNTIAARPKKGVASRQRKLQTIKNSILAVRGNGNLLEGGYTIGEQTFEFREPSKNPDSRVIVIFNGPGAVGICEKTKKALTSQGYSVYDGKFRKDRSFIVGLKGVEEAERVDQTGEIRFPVVKPVSNGANGMSPIRSRVENDSDMMRALETIRKFHGSRLILGVENRDEYVLDHKSRPAVKYSYISEGEVVYTLDEVKRLFGFEPTILEDSKGGETVLSWSLSDIPTEKLDGRSLRKYKTRKIDWGKREFTPVGLIDFLCRSVLRIKPNLFENNGCHETYSFGCFHVQDEAVRREVFDWADRFNLAYLPSEKDARCFWVATDGPTARLFERAVRDGSIEATELIKDLKMGNTKTEGETSPVGKKIRPDRSNSRRYKERYKERRDHPSWREMVAYLQGCGLKSHQPNKVADYKVRVTDGKIYFTQLSDHALMILKRDEAKILGMTGVKKITFGGLYGLNPNSCKIDTDLIEDLIEETKKETNETPSPPVAPAAAEKEELDSITQTWKRILEILKKLGLYAARGGDPADYQRRRNNTSSASAQLILNCLSKKAIKVIGENLDKFRDVEGVDHVSFNDTRQGGKSLWIKCQVESSSDDKTDHRSSTKPAKAPKKSKASTSPKADEEASHVRMFLALSDEERQECLKAAGVEPKDRLQEMKPILKRVVLVDKAGAREKALLPMLKQLKLIVDLDDLLE